MNEEFDNIEPSGGFGWTSAFGNPSDDIEITIDDLYNAIAYAETGSSIHRKNPWIRTTKVGSGSSAYGPVQMTGTLVDENLPRYKDTGESMIKFTEEEEKFLEVFGDQASDFLFFGNEGDERRAQVNPKTKSRYSTDFEYAGKGYSWDDNDRRMYKNVAKKLMKYKFDKLGNNHDQLHDFIKDWRHGATYKGKLDNEYFDKVYSYLSRKGAIETIKNENTESKIVDYLKGIF